MDCQSSQIDIVSLPPTIESAPFFANRLKGIDIYLLVETTVVTLAVILAIKVLSADSGFSWFLTPGILVAAAVVPVAIRGNRLTEMGFNIRQVGPSLIVVFWTCSVIFPGVFLGLWLLKSSGLELPLRPVLPQQQPWICWLFYQFMYIAVAEEVFFRGYVQSNIRRLMGTIMQKHCWLRAWIGILLSATCFAVAHIIIQGQVISALTFLPGLILGWLFVRTRSLLAPILFHGLANTYYCLIAAILA